LIQGVVIISIVADDISKKQTDKKDGQILIVTEIKNFKECAWLVKQK